ncbi:MAG: hypothetical protein QF464_00565, partial [Myxococcota bacterium]|nr:hypothetical protein [Myxococcota bacterium]
MLVADIQPGSGGSDPAEAHALGDRLIFSAETEDEGREPWVSDGTANGTSLVADVAPGLLGNLPASSSPSDVVVIDGRAWMALDDGSSGREPWVTDGTSKGTDLVADVADG